MRALDTNILVRFLMNDDRRQAEKVYRLFKEAEKNKEVFFVSLPVVLELFWVLESACNIARKDILDAIDALLQMQILEFDAQEDLRECITDARLNTFDLPDLLIAHNAVGAGECEHVLTFDKKAAKSQLFLLLD